MFRWLSRDGRRLLAARGTRSFGYGFLAAAVGAYLKDLRYTGVEVGLVLTVALASAALSSIAVGFRGDAWGRRRVLMAYALLMAAAGLILLLDSSLPFILLAVAVGTVSPTGGDIGPFVSLEQAMLPQAADPGGPRAVRPPVRAVRDGLLRRRVRPPVVRRLLVRERVPRGPDRARCDFFRRQHARLPVLPRRRAARRGGGAAERDGGHAPAFERAPDACSARKPAPLRPPGVPP